VGESAAVGVAQGAANDPVSLDGEPESAIEVRFNDFPVDIREGNPIWRDGRYGESHRDE
jgi:hypothetical protein